ncbi:hypothetical protein WSM22_05310 [Cytophagales bacterium WSM2-2]|nr:hypothetical protein WSM22_05310 [Cytophagales bacterium WSM2-2]
MGARVAGMGYASSCVVSDEWSLFNNVGGLAKVNRASSAFAYEMRPSLVGASRMAAGIAIPVHIGTMGLGIFKFGDNIYSEQQASMAFGNSIGNTSLGIKANYIQYQADGYGIISAVSFDFGGITQLTSQLSIGAYINNITRSTLRGADDQYLPSLMVVGAGFRPSEKILIVTEVSKDLDYAITSRTGFEYTVYKKVFFRTGFNINPNTGYGGLGILKGNLKLDFSFQYNQLTGLAYQSSASYLIPLKSRK